MFNSLHYVNEPTEDKPTHEQLEQEYQAFIAAGGKVTQGDPLPDEYPVPLRPHTVSRKKSPKRRSPSDPLAGIQQVGERFKVYYNNRYIGSAKTQDGAVELRRRWLKENVDKN